MPEESEHLLPVALEQRGLSADQRMFSPSAAQNSAPILEVMKLILPTTGVVLEIGCGTGEHAVCFAEAMPYLMWQPSDTDYDSRASTASWVKFVGLKNVLVPLDINVCSTLWGVEEKASLDAIVSINMVHITMHRRFCPTCGTHLFSEAEARPHLIFVRAGTLDNTELARPAATIWTHRAPSWACIDETLPRWEGQPPSPGTDR